MIRITSGIAKGKKLSLPRHLTQNQKITSVKEVVKLAIFSIIGGKISNSMCLDLFAGSGNLGIEALSRGASFCDFIDESKSATEVIEENLKKTKLESKGNVMRDEVLKHLSNTQAFYDIIFCDPYYTETNYRYLIKLSMERLNPKGMLFLLTSSTTQIELPHDAKDNILTDARKYGKTLLSVLTNQETRV